MVCANCLHLVRIRSWFRFPPVKSLRKTSRVCFVLVAVSLLESAHSAHMSSTAAPLWAKHMRLLGMLGSPLLWEGKSEAALPQQGA